MRFYRFDCAPEWHDFWKFAADVSLPEKTDSFPSHPQDMNHSAPATGSGRTSGAPKATARSAPTSCANTSAGCEPPIPTTIATSTSAKPSASRSLGTTNSLSAKAASVLSAASQKLASFAARFFRSLLTTVTILAKCVAFSVRRAIRASGAFAHDGARLSAAIDYLKGTET